MTNDTVAAFVRDITLVLDNDQLPYFEIRERVFEALRHSAGYADMTPDDYDSAIREGRGWEFHGVVGGEVDDYLQDVIDGIGGVDTVAGLLLSQLVNGLTNALGAHYLPAPEDYRDMYDEAES